MTINDKINQTFNDIINLIINDDINKTYASRRNNVNSNCNYICWSMELNDVIEVGNTLYNDFSKYFKIHGKSQDKRSNLAIMLNHAIIFLVENIDCYPNYVKFFKQYNISTRNFYSSWDCCEYSTMLNKKVDLDHEHYFRDNNNNYVIVSSPYYEHDEKFLPLGFVKYNHLYNRQSFTYIKVISPKQIKEELKIYKQNK